MATKLAKERYHIHSFELGLPFGIGKVAIKRTEAQERVAWSLYVEYITRITTQPLNPGDGSIREALSSIYKLFDITRTILKEHGPEVADGPNSVGPLAIRILNEGVRPFLVKWHTRLSAYEQAVGKDKEKGWEDNALFYQELNAFQMEILKYVQALAILAGAEDVVPF